MKIIENPIKSTEARRILGIGPSLFSAIKSKMGLRGRRLVMLSSIQKWWREHPEFREQDVYHRRACECGKCVAKRLAKLVVKGGSAVV